MMIVFFVLELLPMEVTALTTIGMLWLFKIINIEEAIKADLVTLEDEIELFKSISMGINLSIAHCEGNDRCSLPMEEREVKQLVKTLDHRIDSLAIRQSQIDDIIGFNKVLSSYISLRDSYNSFIEKIQSIITNYKDKN